MSYSATEIAGNTHNKCLHCASSVEKEAKFCGSCGIIIAPSSFSINEYPDQFARVASLEFSQNIIPTKLPNFATTGTPAQNHRANELIVEANKLSLLLARERLFLYLQWICFLICNLIGLLIAIKCYVDFIGDEMSKMMVASTPFLFINSVALILLGPMKGTKKEISRLKERIAHVRFDIEFGHLNI